MNYFVVLNQVLVLFIPIIIGIIVKKLKMVDDNFGKSLSGFIFNVSLPCSIIYAMKFKFEKELLFKSGKLILLGFLIVIISLLIGLLFTKIIGFKSNVKNITQFSFSFPNFSYMGYPIINMLFGKEALFYATIFTIPYYFLVNSIGILILEQKEGKRSVLNLKKVFNAPTFAVFIGYFFFLFSYELPYPIDKAIGMFADTTTPMAMILAGLVLADVHILKILSNYRVYVIGLFRLIIIPLFVFFVLKLFKVTGLMQYIPTIISSMPVAANIILLSQKYNENENFSAQAVLITTFLSIFTIPLIYLIIR